MFRRRQHSDFTAEIQAHVELEAARLREQGLPEEEALAAARRAFGNLTAAQERFYYRGRWQWWDQVRQDLRYAVRVGRRSPGFSAVAVLCLALGIGAATAIFSLVNGVLLKPLAYRDPGRLYLIREVIPAISKFYPSLPVNLRRALAWREQSKSVESLAVAKPGTRNLTGSGEPEQIQLLSATANFLDVLGVQPRYGRSFLAGEDEPGRDRVVILTDSFWRRRFRADESALGTSLTLDGNPFVVVGILPPSFTFPKAHELGDLTGLPDRLDMVKPFGRVSGGWSGDHDYIAIARTRPGVSETALHAEINTIEDRLTRQYKTSVHHALIWPLQDQVVSSARDGLWLLLAAVLCLLLIVSLNVANLFLARARARQRELAVRVALGAGRRRLLQQLLTETVLLAGLGGLLGVWLGWVALQLMTHAVRLDIPRIAEVQLDSRVLGFAILLTFASGLIVGAVPALRLAGADPQEALKSGSHTLTDSARSLRVREVLVSTEVAITAVLLIVAGLLVTSLANVLRLNQGFTIHQALTVNVSLPATRYRTPQDRLGFFDRALERLRRIPGVESAAFVNQPPLTGQTHVNDIILEGREHESLDPVTGNPLLANFMQTSPGYFHTLGIALRQGRDLSQSDRSRQVAVVSARLAERLWPGEDPIGKRLREGNPKAPLKEVIGVAADVRNGGAEQPPTFVVYIPYWDRDGAGYGAFVLRTAPDPAAIAPDVRRQIWSVDPELPLPRMRTMGQIVAQATFQRRFQTGLGAAFAMCALLVAALGIYGIVAYTVVQRRTELGIRIALGAQKRDVHWLVLRQGARPVLTGLCVGVTLALLAGQLVRGLLFGVTAYNLPTVALAVLVLLAAALVACYWPARRATRIDPATALRYD